MVEMEMKELTEVKVGDVLEKWAREEVGLVRELVGRCVLMAKRVNAGVEFARGSGW